MDTNKKTKTAAEKREDQVVPDGKMLVKVYAPFRNYFEGAANSISAENDTGPFDILRGHHKFLTLLSPCEILIRTEDNEESAEKIKIDKGIMFVKEDRVTVFLDV
jgi:F0F1-type ATP synthase epsilon subunit